MTQKEGHEFVVSFLRFPRSIVHRWENATLPAICSASSSLNMADSTFRSFWLSILNFTPGSLHSGKSPKKAAPKSFAGYLQSAAHCQPRKAVTACPHWIAGESARKPDAFRQSRHPIACNLRKNNGAAADGIDQMVEIRGGILPNNILE